MYIFAHILIPLFSYVRFHDVILISRSKELRTHVHGQSCNHVSHRGSNSIWQGETVDHCNSPGACELACETMEVRASLRLYMYPLVSSNMACWKIPYQ